MLRTISSFAASLLLLGCATAGPQLQEHKVVVGRVVSSEELIVFLPGGGVDVTAEEWGRIYTFAPLATPTEHITFIGQYECPSAEGGEEIYLVLLDPQTSLTDGRRGDYRPGEYPLNVVGCTPVDERRSAGLR